MAEDENHSHADSCYTAQQNLICTQAEAAAHTHSAECNVKHQQLVCTQQEIPAHKHDKNCYEQLAQLVCTTEEKADGHVHTDECYTENKSLVCTQQEIIIHTHTDSCFNSTGTLICTLPEITQHIHTQDCIGSSTTATVLICEAEEHRHTQSCYPPDEKAELTYICGYDEHTHSAECGSECTIPVHTHTDRCLDLVSDPNADVETEAVWKQTFASVEISETDPAATMLAIAKTQLGYSESMLNFEKDENGKHHGYTRYGAWLGMPYADWSGLFVSFAAHYAGIEIIPQTADVAQIMAAVQSVENLWATAGSHVPLAGDFVFFTDNTVGIIISVTPGTETSAGYITVIKGDADNAVSQLTYIQSDETIAGYGAFATFDLVPLTEEEQARVDAVIKLIEEMPSADEIDAKLMEYEDAEDYEGYEEYYKEIVLQVKSVYEGYRALTDREKAAVTNADKLLELEYIWSREILLDEINSDAPTLVPATGTDPVVSTSEFVKLNIYDYYSTSSAAAAGKKNINTLWSGNDKYPGFQWNGGAYMISSAFSRSIVDNIDFGNSVITDIVYGGTTSGITNGISQNRTNVGRQGGLINDIIQYPTGYWANKPTGISVGNTVMYPTLKNGYPALADGTSLSYLFSENIYAAKKNNSNIDGLFRQNQTSGEYWFDSRKNHAQYANNRFTLYNQIITPNFILYPFGNFLPFNDITTPNTTTQVSKIDRIASGSDTTSGGNGNGPVGYMQMIIERLKANGVDATEQQLISMLAKYRDSLGSYGDTSSDRYNWTAEDALLYYFSNSSEFGDDYNYETLFSSANFQSLLTKLYNIDYDVPKNFMFGMDMEMNFMQPKDGMTGNDTNKDGKSDYQMKFIFEGDDDVWVYIDGILFLDLTGIHRHVGGDIDFVNGKVNYYAMESYIDGAVESTPYKTMTFAEILTDIGGISENELGNYLKTDANGNYTTFKDYTNHTFKFYYMERGTGSSVCRINFNFPLLKRNSISVEKELTGDKDVTVLGNPDFSFQVLKADTDGNKTDNLFVAANTNYTIYDSNNNAIGTGITDENGVVSFPNTVERLRPGLYLVS